MSLLVDCKIKFVASSMVDASTFWSRLLANSLSFTYLKFIRLIVEYGFLLVFIPIPLAMMRIFITVKWSVISL